MEAPANVPHQCPSQLKDPEPIRLGVVCLILIRAPLEFLRRNLHIRSRTRERKASAIGAKLHGDRFTGSSHERAALTLDDVLHARTCCRCRDREIGEAHATACGCGSGCAASSMQ